MDIRSKLKEEMAQWVAEAPVIIPTMIAWCALIYWMVGVGTAP